MKIIIIFGPQMRGNPIQAKASLGNFCKKDQKNHRNIHKNLEQISEYAKIKSDMLERNTTML